MAQRLSLAGTSSLSIYRHVLCLYPYREDLKRGRYYRPLIRHLKWRKDEKDDLGTASLKELSKDALSRLTTDKVQDIPKIRPGFEVAIKAALRELGVDRSPAGNSPVIDFRQRR